MRTRRPFLSILPSDPPCGKQGSTGWSNRTPQSVTRCHYVRKSQCGPVSQDAVTCVTANAGQYAGIALRSATMAAGTGQFGERSAQPGSNLCTLRDPAAIWAPVCSAWNTCSRDSSAQNNPSHQDSSSGQDENESNVRYTCRRICR